VAIFVLEFRREKKIEDQEWEDYLLIGESYGSQELEILVREISKIWCFSGIIDIRDLSNAEKRDKAVRMLRRNFPPRRVGCTLCSRDFTEPYESILSCYANAYHICYGDGWGKIDLGKIRGGAASIFNEIFAPVPIESDEGIFDSVRSVSAIPIPWLRNRISKVKAGIGQRIPETDRLEQESSAVLTPAILHRSGFFSSAKDEGNFYWELIKEDVTKFDALLIKPHPRDLLDYTSGVLQLRTRIENETNVRIIMSNVTSVLPLVLHDGLEHVGCHLSLVSSSVIDSWFGGVKAAVIPVNQYHALPNHQKPNQSFSEYLRLLEYWYRGVASGKCGPFLAEEWK